MRIASRSLRRVGETLASGRPRRARALARLYARKASPEEHAWLALMEANALLWEGEHARAVRHVDERVARLPRAEVLGVLPLVVQIQALIFDERVTEARALFDANESELRASSLAKADVAAIWAMFRFQDGELEEARIELRRVFKLTRPLEPIRRVAHFVLAAIAHRSGDMDDVRRHLDAATELGGALFVVRWAKSQRAELFPQNTEAPPRAPGAVGRFIRLLGAGLKLALFRPRAFRKQSFTVDRVLALGVFDALLVVALRCTEYERGAAPYTVGLVALLVPLAGIALTARVAAGPSRDDARDAAVRIAGGIYASFPIVAVLAYVSARSFRWSSSPFHHVTHGLLALWLTAVLVTIVRSVHRAGFRRLVASFVVYAGTFLFPLWIVNDGLFFYPAASAEVDWTAATKRREAQIFEQADQVHDAESAVLTERPGVTDLYFVGAGGWAQQDVFGRDVRYARDLFDARFDTAGRSLVLVNDPFGLERAPLAAAASLRHVLRAVGAKMNPEEDVLFLYLTSHGSSEGLALSFPRESGFTSGSLTPFDLRSMLDASKIRWRILVIAGCESGIFVGPLSSDTTVVATAAAPDRASYGCGMGNEQTDFGHALFGDHLRRDATILGAMRGAIADIGEAERKDGRTPSHPQLSIGSAIGPKLSDLEAKLADNTPSQSR